MINPNRRLEVFVPLSKKARSFFPLMTSRVPFVFQNLSHPPRKLSKRRWRGGVQKHNNLIFK
uniref:Uncharacterized protein n=1 Tax=Anguilla anguilla TaxID=7936 RepID=A0A0E9WJV1_ANGAN